MDALPPGAKDAVRSGGVSKEFARGFKVRFTLLSPALQLTHPVHCSDTTLVTPPGTDTVQFRPAHEPFVNPEAEFHDGIANATSVVFEASQSHVSGYT